MYNYSHMYNTFKQMNDFLANDVNIWKYTSDYKIIHVGSIVGRF